MVFGMSSVFAFGIWEKSDSSQSNVISREATEVSSELPALPEGVEAPSFENGEFPELPEGVEAPAFGSFNNGSQMGPMNGFGGGMQGGPAGMGPMQGAPAGMGPMQNGGMRF